MRDLLITLIVVGSIPFTFYRPYVGILMWCWISYMNPHRLSWSFAYNMPFAAMIGLTTIAVWLISPREPKKLPITATTILFILFSIWVCITTMFAMVPAEAMPKWEQVMKIFLMTFITLAMTNSQKRLMALCWIIVLSLGFFGLRGGIFTLLTGGEFRVWGPPGSFIEDNNQLALALIMTLPLIRFLQLNMPSRILQFNVPVRLAKFAFWGFFGAVALSVIGTYSRGGFVALAAMIGFLWLKSRHKVLSGATLVVLLGLGLAFMPGHYYERIASIANYQEDASAQGRLDLWLYAWNVALDRPVVGGGFGVFLDGRLYAQYNPAAETIRNVHSIYFEVLGEHGFVGIALFLLLGLSAMWNCSRVLRQARGRPDLQWARDLAGMLQVSLVGYAVGGTFLNLAFFDLPYHIIIMTVALRKIVEAAVKRLPEPESLETAVRAAPAQADRNRWAPTA